MSDPAGLLKEVGLWNGRREATPTAIALAKTAQRLFVRRGMAQRWTGEDAVQDLQVRILSNQDNCLAARANYPTTLEWLRWLLNKCIDAYRRDMHRLDRIEDDEEFVSQDDVLKEVEAMELLEKVSEEARNTEPMFGQLLDCIHLRDSLQDLRLALNLDVKGLNALLARFNRFRDKLKAGLLLEVKEQEAASTSAKPAHPAKPSNPVEPSNSSEPAAQSTAPASDGSK